MTIRAIAGLAGLNLFFLVVGAGVLWGIRGWRWWTELVRLGGAAYLLGVASMTTLLTLALVLGIPFGLPTLLGGGLALFVAGVLFGSSRGHARPVFRPPGWAFPRLTILGALLTAAIVVYLEALFRSGRLAPMSEWDAWRCWTVRAKAVFYFGGFDNRVFESPACPGYPPGFSVVEAAGFHAMGSVDVVTVHLQYWFLAVGFVAALAGLLAPRVRQSVLLPFLLLVLVLPSFTDRVTDGRADLPLAFLVVTAAVLVALWLEGSHRWYLVAATVLFSGALLTKREGLLLVALVLGAALAASWRERRRAWPRMFLTGAAAFALALPWRIWLEAQGLRSGAPPGGYLDLLDHLDRVWPSFELVVRTFFDYDLWLLAAPLALAAAVLAFLAGARRSAVLASAFAAFSVVGCTWAIWAEPDLEITQDYGLNPVVRLVGGPILVLVALTPLLLEHALARAGAARLPWGWWSTRRSVALWVLALAVAAAYPLSMVVGYSGLRLPGGSPSFPSVEDCVVTPIVGRPVRVVLGYAGSYSEANALRDRARAAGFADARIAQDGCGRLRLFLDDLPAADGERIAGEARAAGLRATIEADLDA